MAKRFIKALSRGLKAATDVNQPGRFDLNGKIVRCSHCNHDEFIKGSALLNTAGLTLLGLDWANQSAATLMCTECCKIEWFGRAPTKIAS